MIYYVQISRPFNNVRVYVVKKSTKGTTNALSKAVDSLIKKYVLKDAPNAK